MRIAPAMQLEVDTAVAKMMVVPPDQPVAKLRSVLQLRGAYRGCGARAVECAGAEF